MCNRLGKNHFQYVDGSGLVRQRYEKDTRTGRSLATMYRVRLLNDHCYLRDVFWNPQNNNRSGILKVLTARKQKLYDKLEKYFDRTNHGR